MVSQRYGGIAYFMVLFDSIGLVDTREAAKNGSGMHPVTWLMDYKVLGDGKERELLMRFPTKCAEKVKKWRKDAGPGASNWIAWTGYRVWAA